MTFKTTAGPWIRVSSAVVAASCTEALIVSFPSDSWHGLLHDTLPADSQDWQKIWCLKPLKHYHINPSVSSQKWTKGVTSKSIKPSPAEGIRPTDRSTSLLLVRLLSQLVIWLIFLSVSHLPFICQRGGKPSKQMDFLHKIVDLL